MWRSGQRKSSKQNQDPKTTPTPPKKQELNSIFVIRHLHLWCFQLNWETWSLISVGKPPPDWQKVQICVLICLIKAPGFAGIVFKIWFMYKPSAGWETLLIISDCCRKKGWAGGGAGGDAKPKCWISVCSLNSSEYEMTENINAAARSRFSHCDAGVSVHGDSTPPPHPPWHTHTEYNIVA